MNKYLLLRDNKESGPYTISELISKGIKAYDLVWLEGKSAAWRYSSEIEELKIYAPAVEEQPFDRFYKKKEEPAVGSVKPVSTPPLKTAAPAIIPYTQPLPEHLPYIPKEEAGASKKIYINFPGVQQPATVGLSSDHQAKNPSNDTVIKAATPVGAAGLAQKSINNTVNQQPIARAAFSSADPLVFTDEENGYGGPAGYPQSGKKSSNKTLIFLFAAACLILTGFLVVLIINYNDQRKNIDQLNALVEQIQQKQTVELNLPAASALPNPSTPPTDLTAEDLVEGPPPAANEIPEQQNRAGNHAADKTVPEVKQSLPAASVKNETAPPVKEQIVTGKPNEQTAEASQENLFKLVSVKSNKYKTGVLGGISDLQLELTNNSLTRLQHVEVQVNYLGPEKKLVKSQTVYFENVSPGEQLTLDVPKSSRGVTVEYMISRID